MKKTRGFSLLELMIVIAVIAITLAWAVPSYQDSVRKARRVEAQSQMREFEVCASRQFTIDSSYANVANCQPDDDDYYEYDLDPDLLPLAYKLTAEPKGSQAEDKCGTMTLRQTGAAWAAAAGCWHSNQTSSS